MSTFRIDAPDRNICASAVATDESSHAALFALLKRENESLYACGRIYLSNLTKWRDHFLGVSDRDHDRILAANGNVAPNTACLAITQPRRNATPLSSSSTTTVDASKNSIRPDEHPEILLNWRTRVIAWYFEFIHSRSYEFNTALVALTYLDVYSMKVCFPDECSLIFANEEFDITSPSDEITDGAGCISSPSPSKKSKTSHEDSNIERHQAKPLRDDSIQGFDIVHYRLAAVASLYLACKVFQSSPTIATSVAFANAIGDGTVSSKQIEEMELTILKSLSFQVHPPTSLRFIHELVPLLIPNQPRNCSSSWVPQDDVEDRIISDASTFAALASFCGSEKVPAIISTTPSNIALAAIIEAAKMNLYRGKVVLAQHPFIERLFRQQIIPYTDEVVIIQKCLVELKRLNEQKGKENYIASTMPHTKSTGYRSGSSLSSSDTTDNCREAPTSKSKLDSTKDSATTYAPFRRTVSQSSDIDSPKKTSTKCAEGKIHRIWESVEQCVSAANATSYYFAAEMESST